VHETGSNEPPEITPEYRRPFVPGATVFFTVVTQHRRPIRTDNALDYLRTAIREDRDHTIP